MAVRVRDERVHPTRHSAACPRTTTRQETTVTVPPVEAHCDTCKQLRPLFLYQPDHNAHAIPVVCEWCDREKQPLLCSRCWGAERERELNAPSSVEEQEATAFLLGLAANNGRLIRQAQADREVCDGIAAASAQSGVEP